MALEEYLGLLNPTPQDRNEALTYGLLGLGSGLLQNSTGHYGQFGPALGAGMQAGMVNYRNSMQHGRENRMNEIQIAAKLEEIKQKQEEKARLNKLLSTLTPEQQTAYILGGGDEVAKNLLPNKEKPTLPHFDATRGVFVEAPTTANPGGRVIPLQGLPATKEPPKRNEIKRGNQLITQEWDGSRWVDVATSPLVTEKPEKAPAGYRYTNDGNMEAVPGGPADAKAQAQAQRQAEGTADVDVALSSLRDAYNRLEQGGGITSTNKGSFENMAAATSSSGIGQAAGRLFGTSNQSARNDIAMARPALLAALMKATGMSAKQMDSNAELKLWLSTATDPTLDVESNRRALDNIERKYIKRNIDPLQRQTGSVQATQSTAGQWGIKRVK